MATESQLIKRLIKNQFGVSDVDTTLRFFEEPYVGRVGIFPEQIWAETVPTTAPYVYSGPESSGTDNGVVAIYKSVTLSHVVGTTSTFYSSLLENAIPFNYGDGSYNYYLEKNAGGQIYFGEGDWFVDTVRGTLRFYGTVPTGVSPGSPPKISFFKYIGDIGPGSGGGGGGISTITNVGTAGIGVFKNIAVNNANFYKLNSLSTALTIVLDGGNDKVDFNIVPGQIDHGSIGGLDDDDHTQYVLLVGRSGGQIFTGGTNASDDLTLRSTTSGSKGSVLIDELTDSTSVGTGALVVNGGMSVAKNLVISDTIIVGNTRIISGSSTLGTPGNVTIFTIVLANAIDQYLIVDIELSQRTSSDSAGDELRVLFSKYQVFSASGGNVSHIKFVDLVNNSNFSVVNGTGDRTFYIKYNGVIGDIVSGRIIITRTGINLGTDISSAQFV